MWGMKQHDPVEVLRRRGLPSRDTVLASGASVVSVALIAFAVYVLAATGTATADTSTSPARSAGEHSLVAETPAPTEPSTQTVAHDDSWGVTLPPPPAPSGGGSSGAPGSLVPFIASSDPNNANGGDYLDPAIFCQSGSASGNPPRCD